MKCLYCGGQVDPSTVLCPVCGGALTQGQTLPLGTKLLGGRYTIGKLLGQGGFGITYQGADTALKRVVAIKEFFLPGCTRHNSGVVVPSGSRTASASLLGVTGFTWLPRQSQHSMAIPAPIIQRKEFS